MNNISNTFNIINFSCIIGNRIISKNINITMNSGDCGILTGSNGSGKSTFLKSVTMQSTKNIQFSGTILWNDYNIMDSFFCKYFKNNIHYLDNTNPFYEEFTAFTNIKYWSILGGYDGNELDIMNQLGIYDVLNTPIKHLSLGQLKRLNLCRLMVCPRPLWILDEPTLALDKESMVILESYINDHLSDGGMALIATHTPINVEQNFTIQF